MAVASWACPTRDAAVSSPTICLVLALAPAYIPQSIVLACLAHSSAVIACHLTSLYAICCDQHTARLAVHQPLPTCQGAGPSCVIHLIGNFKVYLSNGAQWLKVCTGRMQKLLCHAAAVASHLGELRDAAACAHDFLDASPWKQFSVIQSCHEDNSNMAQTGMPAANADSRSWKSTSLAYSYEPNVLKADIVDQTPWNSSDVRTQ